MHGKAIGASFIDCSYKRVVMVELEQFIGLDWF